MAALLRRGGALDEATDMDRFLSACLRADSAGAQRQVLDHPDLLEQLGGTALHVAAYAGSDETVRFLLARGGDVEARDATCESTALAWTSIGSGNGPGATPGRIGSRPCERLIEAGASCDGLSLSADEPKPPSPEVAEVLRAHGVGDDHSRSDC